MGGPEGKIRRGASKIRKKGVSVQKCKKGGTPPPFRRDDSLILNELHRLSIYRHRLPYDVYDNKGTYTKQMGSISLKTQAPVGVQLRAVSGLPYDVIRGKQLKLGFVF